MLFHRYRLLGMAFILSAIPIVTFQAQEFDSSAEVAYDLDWKSDGDVLAVAGDQHVWLLDSQMQILDAYPYPKTSDAISPLPLAVEWSPDSKWLATIHYDGRLRVWSYPDGDLVFDRIITERNDPDTIRWHPTQPLLSTYRQIVNVQLGTVEQPFIYDVYWGRSTNDPPLEQRLTGKVFWSPDGTQMIRSVSEASCGPCSEYGVFDIFSDELVQNLGTKFGAWDSFIWSTEGRYRVLDHVLVNDLLFDSQIERMVYIETGAFEYFRMPAIVVVNTFEDQDVINHQVVYPVSLVHIDWTPDTSYEITALTCGGEIVKIDIRDMSRSGTVDLFAPQPFENDSVCSALVFPGYSNP